MTPCAVVCALHAGTLPDNVNNTLAGSSPDSQQRLLMQLMHPPAPPHGSLVCMRAYVVYVVMWMGWRLWGFKIKKHWGFGAFRYSRFGLIGG